MRFEVAPFPAERITVTKFDKSLPSIFAQVLKDPTNAFLKHLASAVHSDNTDVVITNKTTKLVIYMHYRYVSIDANDRTRTQSCKRDMFMNHPGQPVLHAGEHMLVTQHGSLTESTAKQILSGKGPVGSVISFGLPPEENEPPILSIRFTLDGVVLDDGEVLGRETEEFLQELRGRATAAAFLLERIRRAELEGRDVNAEVEVLARLPRSSRDFLYMWLPRLASDYLSDSRIKTEGVNLNGSAQLRLQELAELPNFYHGQ